MSIVAPWVRVAFPGAEVLTAVVYASPRAVDGRYVNFHADVLPDPHYLEWNFFNAGYMTAMAVDMDGLLCHDIARDDDDDGVRYNYAIKHAVPLYVPRRQPVPAIITARLERYRAATVAWLEQHKIACVRLVMGPWCSLAERYASPDVVPRWKAERYADSPLQLFVESDPYQAEMIAAISGKRVLCPKAGRAWG